MFKKYIFLFIGILSIQVSFSQTLDTLKLNNYFKSLESHNKFMGSVALMKNGKIVYTNQVGFADIETEQKPNINTKYRIGSISKTFTAVLIFKAIEEGKLNLDTTLERYYPSIKNSKLITISNLLNHRSGIYNFTNDKAYLSYNTKPKTESEMLSIISKFESDFEPNSKAAYSNSNYLLLSYILEKTYSKNFEEILKEKIFDPIHLKNTFLGNKINLLNNESNSYSFGEEWVKQSETDTSIPLGAGGIISTPSDLLQFAEALFTYKIISNNSLARMQKIEDGYGMGLFKIPFFDKSSFGHTGGIDGFNAVYGYFPNENYAFASTSNGVNYDVNNIAIILLSALFDKAYEIPKFITYKPDSEDFNNYLGVYSSQGFPLKISITKSENVLFAQATGQAAFPLEATDKDKFQFLKAGIVLEFNTKSNTMTLKQGGGNFVLTKEH